MRRANHLGVFVCLTVAVQLFGCATGLAADKYGRRSDHPYLLYTDENIARLKERIENEIGQQCGLEDLYQDEFWDSRVAQLAKAGEFFHFGHCINFSI